jgi:hypothetical protein
VDGEYPSARSCAVPNGWDSIELLQDLGYSEVEIEDLIGQNAVFGYEK